MTKLCKWGNSLGLRVSAAIAVEAGLKPGSPVSIRLLDNGSILVTPLTRAIPVKDTKCSNQKIDIGDW